MASRATRLHHSAVVVKDLGRSKSFYSGVLGLELAATWCEKNERVKRPDMLSGFHHLALNGTLEYHNEVNQRAHAQGLNVRITDHGYCTSMYLSDPDDHLVEVTVDNAVALENESLIRGRAAAELERWLGGDHATNNHLR